MKWISLTQTVANVPGWNLDVTRYYPYDDALACDQADAEYDALSPADQLAKTVAVEPAIPNGYERSLRDCSTNSNGVYIDVDDKYFDGGTSGGGGGTTTPTVGEETNVTFYTSSSNDDGGNK